MHTKIHVRLTFVVNACISDSLELVIRQLLVLLFIDLRRDDLLFLFRGLLAAVG